MSFLMQLLAWVACVVVGTAIWIAVFSIGDFRRWWSSPRLSFRRCPECGGKYDLRLVQITWLPLKPSSGAPPGGAGEPPARVPTGPAEWQVKCASCGLHVVYLRRGKLKTTFRPPPPAPSLAR